MPVQLLASSDRWMVDGPSIPENGGLRSAHPRSIVQQTEVEYSAFLSDYVGTDLFIKREDRQDAFGSGVKIRQISALLEHVLQTGNVPIVMDCVPQSNCGMATCLYADRFGIPLHMLVKCPPTTDRSGNLGRIRNSNAAITWVPNREQLPDHVERVVSGYRAKGLSPTVVPAGANCDITVGGPMGLGVEIAAQERELGLRFDHLALAVASGGTYAGLQISTIHHGRDWRIHAVRTDNYDDGYYQDTYASKRRHLALSPEQSRLLPDRLELYEGATLGGYGMFGAEHAREALRIYDQSGIFFGPTYALKALIGVRKMVAEGIIPSGAATLLIHTGGINEQELLLPFLAAHAAG